MQRQAFTFVICMLLFGATDAAAQVGQPWTERFYFNLNGGFESSSASGLEDARTFRIYDEDGSLTASQNVDSGALIDFSVGARVWRNVTAGIGFHSGSNSSDGVFSGNIPNPLFFNRPRSFAGGISDLDRTESAVHLQFGYMLRLTDKIDVHVTVGPSFFTLKQDVISGIDFTEGAFPFNNVTVAVSANEQSESAVGANGGIDVAYRLIETGRWKIGAGLFLRYAGATADLTLLENVPGTALTPVRSIESDLGGLQFGLGARLRF